VRFMGPSQIEARRSSARCSLARWGQISWLNCCERSRGEVPLQRTHNTLVLKATQRATGDIAASCCALTGDFTNYSETGRLAQVVGEIAILQQLSRSAALRAA
jgi:hypothetical protein